MLDRFRGYLEQCVCRILQELRSENAIIPGGFTSLLQPLDVCVNKTFKDKVRCLCMDWMGQGGHTLMPTGKVKRLSVELVCSWVLYAWRSLPSRLIATSFKKTSIANELDGSELELCWYHGVEEAANDLDSKSSDSHAESSAVEKAVAVCK